MSRYEQSYPRHCHEWRRLSVTLLTPILSCSFIFCQLTEIVLAAGLESAIPNCPEWLAAADSILDECNARARYFTRTFFPSGGSRGEKEEHSTCFAPSAGDSHFLMGCTLRSNRSLSFLGLYYTAEPSAIAQANTAPILGIDFDGDVVLSIDGHPVTFTAVQPFDTLKVKTRWSGSHTTALNCQSSLGQDGGYHLMRGNTFVDFSRFDSEGVAAVGYFPSAMKSYKYAEFFRSSIPRQIIYAWYNSVLVMTSGGTLVREDDFSRACHEGVPQRIAKAVADTSTLQNPSGPVSAGAPQGLTTERPYEHPHCHAAMACGGPYPRSVLGLFRQRAL